MQSREQSVNRFIDPPWFIDIDNHSQWENPPTLMLDWWKGFLRLTGDAFEYEYKTGDRGCTQGNPAGRGGRMTVERGGLIVEGCHYPGQDGEVTHREDCPVASRLAVDSGYHSYAGHIDKHK
jgi:hypothetical protein